MEMIRKVTGCANSCVKSSSLGLARKALYWKNMEEPRQTTDTNGKSFNPAKNSSQSSLFPQASLKITVTEKPEGPKSKSPVPTK
ncbi:MAG: hypothetical protein WAL30_06225 [Candidatus Aquirickettsiella sp.]